MEEQARQVEKISFSGNVRQVEDTFDIDDKGTIDQCDILREERVGQVDLNTLKAGR